MPREAVVDSRQEILRTAARLFQQREWIGKKNKKCQAGNSFPPEKVLCQAKQT